MDTRKSLFNSLSKLINDLEAGLNKHVNKRLEMEGRRQQARANTLARREELEERLRKGAEEVERCDTELQPVEAELEETEGERMSRRRRAEEELQAVKAAFAAPGWSLAAAPSVATRKGGKSAGVAAS